MTESFQHIRKGPMVAVMLLGAFFALLNETLLATALPEIMVHFDIGAHEVQWLTTAFLLTNGIMIPISAFFIGKFTTRQIFITAITVFTFGTAVAAFSDSFALLLVARIVQAMGSGVMMPLMMTVLLNIFPVEKRGTAMGLMGLVISFAPAIGPTLSGLLIEYYNWRMLFYAVLPIAVLTWIMAFIFIKNVTEQTNPRIDVISIVMSSLGFGGLLYGFSTGSERGWDDALVISCVAGGFLIIGLFVWRQLRLQTPLLEFRVFKNRDFSIGLVVSVFVIIAMISAETILPMYMQTARGLSALDSGLMLLPGAIVIGVMSPITGILFDKFGVKKLAIPGMLIVVVTTFFFTTLDATTSVTTITIVYAIRMFGLSFGMMPVMTHALNQIPAKLNAHGSAMANTMQQVGAAIGTAILITIMTQVSLNFEPDISNYAGLGAEQLEAAVSAAALYAGYGLTFTVATGMALVGAALVLFLKERRKDAVKAESIEEERMTS